MQREGENIEGVEPDGDVSGLLGSLKRIEAPENFESNVRRRIASGERPAVPERAMWLLGLKFALPALVLVAVGAFLFYYNSRSPEMTQMPEVIDPLPANRPATGHPTAVNNINSEVAAVVPNANLNTNSAVSRPNINAVRDNNPTQTAPVPQSEDKALNPAARPIFPRGMGPNPDLPANKSPVGGAISPETILSFLGIKSACSDKGCKVSSVDKKSIGERSGVLAGDVVEALDDKPIDAGHPPMGSINLRSLKVIRDRKSLTITLRLN